MAKKELQDHLKQLKRKVIVPVAAATLGLSPQAVSAQIPQDDKDKQNPTTELTIEEIGKALDELYSRSRDEQNSTTEYTPEELLNRFPSDILKKDTTCVEIASENPDENTIRVFLHLGRIVKIYDGDKPLPLTSENIELYTRKLAEMGKFLVHPNHHGFHLSVGTARAELGQKGAEQTQTEDPYSYASSLKKQKDEKNQRKIKKPLPIVFIKDSGGKDL